jgi:hypothetical protein
VWFDGLVTDDDPDAIWRSDDVPVPEPSATDSFAGGRLASEEVHFDPLTDEQELPPRRLGAATVVVAAAIAAIVGVAAIVSVVTSGSDESAAPGDTQPSTTPVDSVVDETVERTEPSTTTATTTTTGAVAPVPEEIELPTAVAAIGAPTEVLALSQTGLLYTLSLPSGRVRTVDLEGVSDSSVAEGYGAMVVAPDSAAVGFGGSGMVVVPRSGEAVDVGFELDPDVGGTNVEGWLRGEDGSTRFVVVSYPSQGGDIEFSAVSADGELVELPDGFDPSGVGPAAGLQGELIVNDAGGAYRIAADGTSMRIEDGVVLAYDGRHRMVRECDEARLCSTVIVSEADGSRRVIDPAVLPDDVRELVYGIVLSPDGSAASMLRSGPLQQQRVIVDFAAGEVASETSDSWLVGSTWAADSSGVFDLVSGELQFLDRASGESVAFAEELGPFVSIGVRRPDAELPPEVSVVSTELTPTQAIAPTGLVLVAAGRTGGIGVLSVDSLELTTWQSPPLGRGPAVLAASGDAVLALPADGGSAFLTTPALDTSLGESFATSSPMLVGPTDDTIWVADDTAPPTDVRYRLLRLDGAAAEDLGSAVVDLPDSTLLGGDGRGALVVERRGDVFVVGVEGAVRLTSGELIAIGASTAYVRECESVVDCPVIRIDRTTDTRTLVSTGTAVLDTLGAVDATRGAALGTTVSPDGDVLVSRAAALSGGLEPTMQTVLVDIRTGDVTFVDAHVDDQPVVWNAESTFAALLVGPVVEIYDRAGDRTVGLDGARIRAIGPAPGTQTAEE